MVTKGKNKQETNDPEPQEPAKSLKIKEAKSNMPKTPQKKVKKGSVMKEEASTDESLVGFDTLFKGSEKVSPVSKTSPEMLINALMVYSGALDLKTPPKKIKFREEKKAQLLHPIIK